MPRIWGDPQFMLEIKKAEKEGEANIRIVELLNEMKMLVDDCSTEVYIEGRRRAKYMFELFDETEVNAIDE